LHQRVSHKRAQGTQSRSYFASNHFAKKLVMISANQWLKTQLPRSTKKNYFVLNYFAEKIRTHPLSAVQYLYFLLAIFIPTAKLPLELRFKNSR
jgi:hypothetical protein